MRKRARVILFICILSAAFIMIVFTVVNNRKPYDNPEAVQEVTFQATVIEVTDNSIIVKPADDSLELNSADKFSIPNKEELPLQIGDTVEIVYDGSILESYPAQLGEVYKITLLE